MLCEQCHAKEAVIEFSAMTWLSGDVTRHLCESCYPEVEAERISFYAKEQKPVPVIDVERITAPEYLDFASRAQVNGRDALVYRFISDELKRFPATRERLGIEFLTLALQEFERGADPWNLIGMGSSCGNAMSTAKAPTYIGLLEKIVVRSIDLVAQSQKAPSSHPYGFGLRIAAIALRRNASVQYAALLQKLRDQQRESQPIQTVLDYIDQHLAKLDDYTRRKKDKNE